MFVYILFLVVHVLIYGATATFPFRNISLSWKERVEDLVSRLTIEEIMYQMARGGAGSTGGPAPAIPRLGIGPYRWDTECLSGDVGAGNATSFPISINLAASFSPDLIFRVAEATAIEVRAKHNKYIREGIYTDHTGLSCFSPVINIMRHPLWGRNQETYGEDPFLSGVYAMNFIRGLQGDHPRYVRANGGCKHFDAHGGPDNVGGSRFSFNSVVSERDWRLTFLPAFRKCVEAGSYSLMCSYNSVITIFNVNTIRYLLGAKCHDDSLQTFGQRDDYVGFMWSPNCSINGIPACANRKLLTTILRDEWNFTGYIVSDWSAIEDLIYSHHYYDNEIEAVTGSVNAGCNLELSPNLEKPVFLYMVEAINKSLLLESTARESVKPLFYTRMRLGEFDPPSMNPYTKLNMSVIESYKHRQLAVEAAVKSYVLLKNKNSFLPFSERIKKIAVVGPMANNSKQLFGDYSAKSDPKFTVTPLEGLSKLSVEESYAAGCNDGNRCRNYSSQSIMNAVKDASVIFVCLGTGTDVESEGRDRYNMELPGKQLNLLQDVVQYAPNVPVVLILFSAGPLNVTWPEDSEAVHVIMQCFLPAQATGEALFDVLTKKLSPAGRLPYTWYRDANQLPSMVNYTMKERTYRYFTGEPLYPFGYGLSYTKFQYSNLILPNSVKAGEPVPIDVSVTNTGSVDSDEVVQVYIAWKSTTEEMPNLQLVAFDRIFIPHNGDLSPVEIKLSIEPRSLAIWTETNGFVIEQGSIKVYVGGQQPNQKKSVPSNVLSGIVTIYGTKYIS